MLLFKHHRHGIKNVAVVVFNYTFLVYISEKRNFIFNIVCKRMLSSANNNVRADTDRKHFLNRVLSRLALKLVRSGKIRNKCYVNEKAVFSADFNRKLKLINIWTNDYFEQFSIERIKVIVTPQDVIIVFSLGGKSKDVNNSILQAKRHGATVLTITTLGNHLLSKISDHMIFVYDAPKNVKICVRIRCSIWLETCYLKSF